CGSELVTNAVGHDSGVLAAGGKHQAEFVAADAPGQIVGASVGAQDSADAAQRLVTCGVAVAVVDRLEVVDVNQKQAGGPAFGVVGGEQAAGVRQPVVTAGQPGQRVAPVERVELAILALNLAHQAIGGQAHGNGVDDQQRHA